MEDIMTESLKLIPLSRLIASEANVRKTNAHTGLDELVASIAAHGLLQNLTVKALRKPNGKFSGTFEVIAGSRRLAALKRLADEGRIDRDHEVPCHVLDGGNPVEVSIAENVVRAPLHPADQFEAFAALHAEGLGAEEIAGRFGISPLLVEQRLKLAAVSPRLMAVYREAGLTLEQLMAFTISDDHEAQERVWFESALHARDQHAIRRALTRALVEGTDRRAVFVGAQAYEAAGGTIVRDLFRAEGEGYFTDSELLDRLANEKIQAIAEQVKAEGWSWVDVLPQSDYAYLNRMGRIRPAPVPISEESSVKLEALGQRYDALIEEHGESPPEDIAEELERLSEEMEALTDAGTEWTPEDRARTGAVIALDYQGELRIDRGLVKPSDKPNEKRKMSAKSASSDERDESKTSGLPDTLVADLSAHRTAALRVTLAEQPDLALTALVHVLALRTFFDPIGSNCVDVRPTVVNLEPLASGIGESRASRRLHELHESWRTRLPDEDGLWSWVREQDVETRLCLLAYCSALTVNAVEEKTGWHPERIAQATAIAMAGSLDMADWWLPTRDRYLGRISKKRILDSVAEGVSAEVAQAIANLKKDAMIARAEELLGTTRWLPAPLRMPSAPESVVAEAA
jgi:ParB family chromosome partitioning protein